jgi:hypothetical protein
MRQESFSPGDICIGVPILLDDYCHAFLIASHTDSYRMLRYSVGILVVETVCAARLLMSMN